jgi:hypothetical protein
MEELLVDQILTQKKKLKNINKLIISIIYEQIKLLIAMLILHVLPGNNTDTVCLYLLNSKYSRINSLINKFVLDNAGRLSF